MNQKNLCVGILAHVDAGKTTLSESLLYESGSIRKLGRVDRQDAFLDTNPLERERGITIFSKQAVFSLGDYRVTLLDTPGHVDFAAEMERCLQVLDYAILVISGADGVQGHTITLWKLLERYQVPVFLFFNKMDQVGTNRNALMEQVKKQLDSNCVDFTADKTEDFFDAVAMCDETAMEQYLSDESVTEECLVQMIAARKLFPCYFGSALKLDGVKEFLKGIHSYAVPRSYPKEFAAKVFKIARDAQGNRLTFLKVTGGSLAVKTNLKGNLNGQEWEEKINQLRIYSGEKYEVVQEVNAGEICAATGLTMTYPGEGLGSAGASDMPVLEPVLTYRIELPDDCSAGSFLPKLRQLEEEEPQLHVVWNEDTQEILIQLMGEVQIEILQRLIKDRFGVTVSFGTGSIVYKETIADTVEGVGHFEPLRHYAEVHLLLEPGEAGSGIVVTSDCSEDVLNKNWQRLIMTHLEEREHKGVLTGAAVTDIKITVIGGRAHQKHTEGGDFRQATYRAVRQGLMQATSVLLEPVYTFRIDVSEELVGRVMTDVEKMSGHCNPPVIEDGIAVLTGSAPVATMQDYQKELTAYSKGRGRIFCTLKGYEPCHNTQEVVAAAGYDPLMDRLNPTESVFCAHGAGFLVPWNEVYMYMHVPLCQNGGEAAMKEPEIMAYHPQERSEWIDVEEVDAILEKTFEANKRNKSIPRKGVVRKHKTVAEPLTRTYAKKEALEKYLLVDGYNVIFAWQDLKELAEVSIDAARGKLMDILCNYQAIRGGELIVVFDAYRMKGHQTEYFDYHNIHVVYTKEAETADQYIEKFTHENGKKYDITVATSDGLEQIIIRGAGAHLISSRELYTEIISANAKILEEFGNLP